VFALFWCGVAMNKTKKCGVAMCGIYVILCAGYGEGKKLRICDFIPNKNVSFHMPYEKMR